MITTRPATAKRASITSATATSGTTALPKLGQVTRKPLTLKSGAPYQLSDIIRILSCKGSAAMYERYTIVLKRLIADFETAPPSSKDDEVVATNNTVQQYCQLLKLLANHIPGAINQGFPEIRRLFLALLHQIVKMVQQRHLHSVPYHYSTLTLQATFETLGHFLIDLIRSPIISVIEIGLLEISTLLGRGDKDNLITHPLIEISLPKSNTMISGEIASRIMAKNLSANNDPHSGILKGGKFWIFGNGVELIQCISALLNKYHLEDPDHVRILNLAVEILCKCSAEGSVLDAILDHGCFPALLDFIKQPLMNSGDYELKIKVKLAAFDIFHALEQTWKAGTFLHSPTTFAAFEVCWKDLLRPPNAQSFSFKILRNELSLLVRSICLFQRMEEVKSVPFFRYITSIALSSNSGSAPRKTCSKLKDFEYEFNLIGILLAQSSDLPNRQYFIEEGAIECVLGRCAKAQAIKRNTSLHEQEATTFGMEYEVILHGQWVKLLSILLPIGIQQFIECDGLTILSEFLHFLSLPKVELYSKHQERELNSLVYEVLDIFNYLVQTHESLFKPSLNAAPQYNVLVTLDSLIIDLGRPSEFIARCLGCMANIWLPLGSLERSNLKVVDHLIRILAEGETIYPGSQEPLFIIALDCLWTVLYKISANQDAFIAAGGVLKVLARLDARKSRAQHNMALGVILDLLEQRPELVHTLIECQVGGVELIEKQDLFPRILELWREVEGVIDPLNHTPTDHGRTLSPMELKLSYALREKLFCMFSALKPFYPIGGLGVVDQKTVLVLIRYVDFALGRAWRDMRVQLAAQRVQLIDQDAQVHDVLEQEFLLKQEEVMQLQCNLDRQGNKELQVQTDKNIYVLRDCLGWQRQHLGKAPFRRVQEGFAKRIASGSPCKGKLTRTLVLPPNTL